jgi:hypothetical protein
MEEDDSRQERNEKIKKYIFGVVVFISVAFLAKWIISDLVSSISETDFSVFLSDGDREDIEKLKKTADSGVTVYTYLTEKRGTGEASASIIDIYGRVNTTGDFISLVSSGTYILDLDDGARTVCLIGVNVDSSYKEEIKAKLEDEESFLVEADITSDENPLPVYLYFLDGTMVQEWLLENGYATIDKMADNKYEEEFKSVLDSLGE